MDPLNAEDPVTIGPFRLIGRLGVGGMGRVFLARSAGGRTVAVKVVHAELAAQDEFRRRFAREVAALERVGGTGTAPVLGSDTGAELPWVAVGYVPGPSLRSVVGDAFGPLPPDSVRTLASGLARALVHVHAAGLVHRDLKPSNVLLTVDGPKIIDFGIARAVDTVTDGGLTSTGAVVGSPGFMSPEQVRGEKLTPASDVFCLGSVLAYAATGRTPFGGADSGVHATMFRIAHDEPDLTDLAPELSGLIRACLTKDAAGRPTATELVDTLQVTEPWLPADLLARLGRHAALLLETEAEDTPLPERTAPTDRPDPATPAAPTDPTAPETAPRRPRRRGLTAAVTALTALAVAGAAVLAYTYWPSPGGGTGGPDGKGGNGRGSSASGRPAGIVPAAFLGAWEGVLRGAADAPYETSRIEITQGAAGSRSAVYTHVTGERLCIGRAVLLSATDAELVLGDAEITASVPGRRCTPAARQTLRLRANDVVEWSSGVARSTFQRARTGASVVPAPLLGTWNQVPLGGIAPPDADRWVNRLTVSQGPVGAALVRVEQVYPRTDADGNNTPENVHCTATAVVGGAGPLLVVGPQTRDPDVWDPDCVEDGSTNLRIVRYQGKDRLLVYGMSADGEPGEYQRG
ncbi:serine/threonine-protein kinase [Streptomyces sp. NPDC050600]|uniref:serine/threonine-protein kinase n=1 Tax=Streptomyces sp. NPDC050600 TaxID=3157213 RepID=UPI003438AA14